MIFLFHLLSFIVFADGKSIGTTSNWTQTVPTTTVTSTSTSTWATTTIVLDEASASPSVVEVKPYEYQSNFSRSKDSVFVSLIANQTDRFYSINNTFQQSDNHSAPVEIELKEHTILSDINYYFTKIRIYLNGALTREFASQIGDRLMDFADLLSEMRSISNQTEVADLH